MTSVEPHIGRHLGKTNGCPFDIAPNLNPASAMHFLAVPIHRTTRTRSLLTNISNDTPTCHWSRRIWCLISLFWFTDALSWTNLMLLLWELHVLTFLNIGCVYFSQHVWCNYPQQMEVDCVFSSSCLYAWRPGRPTCCVIEYNMHQRPLHTSVFIMHASVCNDLLLPRCDNGDQ